MSETDTRISLMEAVERRAIEARIGLSALCRRAGLSYTISTRWRNRAYVPTLPTIGKLEDALETFEQAKAA